MEEEIGEREIAVYQAQRTHELELNRATAAFEHAMTSPLFLLNGGATVAFLTLLGASARGDSVTFNRGFVVGAVVAWTVGLLVGALAVRAAYLAQQWFSIAVGLRRYMIEDALMKGSLLANALKREEPTNPREVDPKWARDKAKKYQSRWTISFWLALVFFLIGVILASIALGIGEQSPAESAVPTFSTSPKPGSTD